MSLQVSSVSTVSDPKHKSLRTELKKKKRPKVSDFGNRVNRRKNDITSACFLCSRVLFSI